MGGATAVRAHAERFGPRGRGLTLGGLYDAAEQRAVGRALERAGLGPGLDRAALEDLGFYECDADLEDELIRALGVAGVEAVLDRQGDLASFRRFQAQPAQRDRPPAAQLHRFMGTRSGRKWQYAALLTDAVDCRRRAAAARPRAQPGARVSRLTTADSTASFSSPRSASTPVPPSSSSSPSSTCSVPM